MSSIVKDLGIATAYGYAKSQGYTGTEEEFAVLMASYASVGQEAVESALKAEGFAVGTQDGETSPEYAENNAEYFKALTLALASQAASSASVASQEADSAEIDALKAEGWAIGEQNGASVPSSSPYYENNARWYASVAGGHASTATTKAGEASQSAENALRDAGTAGSMASVATADALKAEGYAVGKQNGVDVASGSPYYENNAKFYAEYAEDVKDSIPLDYTNLSNEVQDLKSATDNEIRTIKAVPVGDMFIRKMSFTDGTWLNNNNNFKHFAYPIDPGDIVHVKCSGGASYYAVVTDYAPVSGNSVPFSSAEGYTSSKSLPNSGTTFTAPNDAKYLLVMVVSNGVNRSISEFTLNGYDLTKSVAGNYVALKGEMETADNTEKSNRIAERTEIDGYIPGAIGASDFTITTLYKTDGTTTTASSRTSTDFIPCDGVEKISFKLIGTTNPALALVSFFDASKNFIGCIPATDGNPVEKADIYIPSTAKYLRGTFLTSATWTPYIYLYKEDSEIGDVDNKVAEIESKTFSEVDLNPKFTNPFIWYSNGTSGILSQRGSSEYVKCEQFDYIIYKLQAFTGVSPVTNVISFFTDDMTYISGVASAENNTVEGIAKVPTNAVYCCGSFLQSAIPNLYMKGATENNTLKEISDLNAITGNVLQTVPEIVNQTMTKKEFLTAVNAKWTEYAALCLCWEGSFRVLRADIWNLYTWDQIHEMINENFRWDVWKEGMSYDLFCKRVNIAFTMRIRRFEDAVLNNSTVCDFSLKFTERSGEPSAIVSEDGSTLYLYTYQKRFATQDGVTWSEPESVVYDTNQLRPEHYNCNLIDGVYYIIGRDNGWGGAGNDLRLWTSTDGVNFTFRGILLPMGYEFVNGDAVTGWGNSYLIKQNGTWFLYIEYTTPTTFWEFSLVTCTDLFHANQDGTIGNWTNYSGNPIMGSHIFSTVDLNASGNPDFAKGEDNRPIRVDGKWYMYFHCTYNSDMYLMRAYSYDLYQWTIEGRLFDNRDIPTDGHATSANADQAIIEFKGRTYLFYTYDINTVYTPYIHYMIDDRPIREILKLYP